MKSDTKYIKNDQKYYFSIVFTSFNTIMFNIIKTESDHMISRFTVFFLCE